MTSQQVAEWLAFINIEGLGNEEAENFRAGQICSAIANFSTWQNKEPLRPSDFFQTLKPVKKPEKPILLKDKEAHARLIMSQVFGTTMESAYRKK